MSTQREHFSSKLGFVLAAAGSAVGIGNLVGFPVAATKNGGGAFLLIYAFFVVLICLPVMIAEMSLGRRSQKDPLGTYSALSEGSIVWKLAGAISIITPFMISVFYMVLTVWLFGYLTQAFMGGLDTLADPDNFNNFINSKSIFVYMIVAFAIVNFILIGGVKDGIERAARLLMPSLFVMLLILVVYVLTLDNAMAGVKYYLVPDFSKIDASVVNGALSQAFFSLSLGMGVMITYGSYLNKQDDITGSAKFVAFVDTLVAFTAGLMILPAIFSFNPNTDSSTLSDSSVTLIFSYLPQILYALQDSIGYTGASIVAVIFFMLVFFAAITSLVSIIEVPVASFIDELKMSRKKALMTMFGLMAVLSILSAMSFGMVDGLTQFISYGGSTKSLFDFIVEVFYETVLPLNGLLVCLFVVYRWKKANFHEELSTGNPNFNGSLLQKYVDFSLSTFIPVFLLLIFLNTVLLKYFGINLITG